MNALRVRWTKVDPPVHAAFDLDVPLDGDPKRRMFERLCMALNAFGVNKREAKFEADLVASWASMYNLPYKSVKEDLYVTALQKIFKALRGEMGLKVYNFCVGRRSGTTEVDLKFLEYARSHRQSNATN
jgi:hypothetical protein